MILSLIEYEENSKSQSPNSGTGVAGISSQKPGLSKKEAWDSGAGILFPTGCPVFDAVFLNKIEYFPHFLVTHCIQYKSEALCRLWKGVQKAAGIPKSSKSQTPAEDQTRKLVNMELMLEGKGLGDALCDCF